MAIQVRLARWVCLARAINTGLLRITRNVTASAVMGIAHQVGAAITAECRLLTGTLALAERAGIQRASACMTAAATIMRIRGRVGANAIALVLGAGAAPVMASGRRLAVIARHIHEIVVIDNAVAIVIDPIANFVF